MLNLLEKIVIEGASDKPVIQFFESTEDSTFIIQDSTNPNNKIKIFPEYIPRIIEKLEIINKEHYKF